MKEDKIISSLDIIKNIFTLYGYDWCTNYESVTTFLHRNHNEIKIGGRFNQELHDKLIKDGWKYTDTLLSTKEKLNFEYFKKDEITIFLNFD